MVFSAMATAPGIWLSVSEIRNKIFENESEYLSVPTIVRAIDEINHIRGDMEEKQERRGVLRIPTKVFSLNLKID